jgi:hypothetical protein
MFLHEEAQLSQGPPRAPACSGLMGVRPACTVVGRNRTVVSTDTPRDHVVSEVYMNEVWRARVALSRVGARVVESGPGGENLAASTWQRLEALPDPRSVQGRICPLACLVAIAVCAFTERPHRDPHPEGRSRQPPGLPARPPGHQDHPLAEAVRPRWRFLAAKRRSTSPTKLKRFPAVWAIGTFRARLGFPRRKKGYRPVSGTRV